MFCLSVLGSFHSVSSRSIRVVENDRISTIFQNHVLFIFYHTMEVGVEGGVGDNMLH